MSIQNYLNQIKTAVFGKDVRQSIHDAIKQCYDDASVDHDNANMEVKLARGTHETLNDRITENEKNQENLSSQLDNKANKNEIFTMANMGQDIKESMTGGSVAVVGKNAILNENIVDGQVYGEKTNFLNQLNKNLFDGKFLNYYLTGDDKLMKLTKDATGKMFIIDIKPNTKYSINKKQVGIDGDNYYFKVATFTKNAENVISLVESGDVTVDGSVVHTATQNTTERTNYIFTSGNNDKSLAVLVGKTKMPYTEVCEGEYTYLQYDSYNGLYELKDNVNIGGKLINDKSLGVEKLSFLEETNKNLFDGKFLPFYISGPSNGIYKLVRSDLYKTLILEIEPDTTYTLLKDPTELEDGYYYTKIASFTLPKEQLVNTNDYMQDGSIGIGITNSDTTRLKFTTGPNDKSIVITVAKSQTPYVEVLKGEYTSFQDNSYERKYYYKDLDYYRKSEVDEKLKSIATNTFIKNGEICDILLNGKVGYRLEHKITSGISLNTWMLTRGTVNEITLWSGSDIEAPIKEKGAADFIGGVHGDETFETVEILCDGVLLDLSQNYNLSFKNLTVFVKSTLNRCETNIPVFTRYKKLEFTSDELLISNRLVCLVDNFLVERHTGCGLYSVYKDLLLGYSVNTKPELIKDGGQGNNVNMDIGTFYGEGFTITLKTISGKTNAYKGSVADFKNESRPRYKLYFDCINSYEGYKIDANTELNTCFSIKIV